MEEAAHIRMTTIESKLDTVISQLQVIIETKERLTAITHRVERLEVDQRSLWDVTGREDKELNKKLTELLVLLAPTTRSVNRSDSIVQNILTSLITAAVIGASAYILKDKPAQVTTTTYTRTQENELSKPTKN